MPHILELKKEYKKQNGKFKIKKYKLILKPYSDNN